MDNNHGFIINDGVLSGYTGKATEIVIPNGVKAIGDSAFENRSELVAVTVPGSVEHIGKAAFYGCTALERLVLKSGTHTIENDAFGECEALSRIMIEDGAGSVDIKPFEGTPWGDALIDLRTKAHNVRNGLCRHCGGTFDRYGQCTECGAARDYMNYGELPDNAWGAFIREEYLECERKGSD